MAVIPTLTVRIYQLREVGGQLTKVHRRNGAFLFVRNTAPCTKRISSSVDPVIWISVKDSSVFIMEQIAPCDYCQYTTETGKIGNHVEGKATEIGSIGFADSGISRLLGIRFEFHPFICHRFILLQFSNTVTGMTSNANCRSPRATAHFSTSFKSNFSAPLICEVIKFIQLLTTVLR